MRYQHPRKALPSREKGYDTRPLPAPEINDAAGRFIEDDKGRYVGNMPFTKPVHKKMKTYRGNVGES